MTRAFQIAAGDVDDVRVYRIDGDVYGHEHGVNFLPRISGIRRAVCALGRTRKDDVGILRMDADAEHASLLVIQPIDGLYPRIASVGALQKPDPVTSPGSAYVQSSDGILIPVHFARSDVDDVGVSGIDGDGIHSQYGITGIDVLPIVIIVSGCRQPP